MHMTRHFERAAIPFAALRILKRMESMTRGGNLPNADDLRKRIRCAMRAIIPFVLATSLFS
jgi:hypothetical protein